jgi:N-methylhydantoinase A
VAFGGAGPLHAGRLARALGINTIIVPYGAGVGSAIGMLEANSKLDASVTRLLQIVPGVESQIGALYRDLEERVLADVGRMKASARPAVTRFAYMRYAGQGHEIRVDLPEFPMRAETVAQIVAGFEQAYEKKYGYRQAGAVVEAVDWYIVASIPYAGAGTHRAKSWKRQASGAFERGRRAAYFPETKGYVDCAVIDRGALPVGVAVAGPAIIEEAEATTVVLPEWTARVSPRGHLIMTPA